MDESDDSMDFVADTPSPVFSRHPVDRTSSKDSIIDLCSSDDNLMSPVSFKNPRRDGFLPNHSGDNSSNVSTSLALPGQPGFAAQRAAALRKRRSKEFLSKDNGMKNGVVPHRYGLSDCATSRVELKQENSKCPDFIKASSIQKNLHYGNSDAAGTSNSPARKMKHTAGKHVSMQRRKKNILRWPSSSDSSSDEDDDGERLKIPVFNSQSRIKAGTSSPEGKHLKRKHSCPCSHANGKVKCLKCMKTDYFVNMERDDASTECCGLQGTSASSVSPCKKYKVSPTSSAVPGIMKVPRIKSNKVSSASSVIPNMPRLKSNTRPVQSLSVDSSSSSSAKSNKLPTSSERKFNASPNKSPIRVSRFYNWQSQTSPTSSKSPSPRLSRSRSCHKQSPNNNLPSPLLRMFSSSPGSEEEKSSPVVTHASSQLSLSKKSESKRSLFGKCVPTKKQPGTSTSSSSALAAPLTSSAPRSASRSTGGGVGSVLTSGTRRARNRSGGSPLTPATKQALDQLQQVEKDEDIARKLQEELDHEFAMSLQDSSPAHHHPPFSDDRVYGATGGHSEPGEMPAELDVPSLLPARRGRRIMVPSRNSRAPSRAPPRGVDLAQEPGVFREELLSLLQSMHTALESRNMDINNEYLMSPRSRQGRGRRGRRNGIAGFVFNSLDDSNDYEHLMNLAEALGDVKEKGLSEVETSRLPTVTYQPAEGTETPECNICMTEYEKGETQKILPCFHTYHATCIDKWIQKNATCPVCRVEVKL